MSRETLTVPTTYKGDVELRSYDTGNVKMVQDVPHAVPMEVKGRELVPDVYDEANRKASVSIKTRSGDEAANVFVTPAVARRVDVWLSHVKDGYLAD